MMAGRGAPWVVLGAGAWGTAWAALLGAAGRPCVLVARRPELAREIADRRENAAYLPGVRLAEVVEVTADLGGRAAAAAGVLLAGPVAGVRGWAVRWREEAGAGPAGVPVVCLAKGLEEESGRTPGEVARAELPGHPVGVLGGPTHAGEVAAGRPAAAVLAFAEAEAADADLAAWQAALSTPALRLYAGRDPLGLGLAGGLKNVYAIACGCSDGLGLGDNARAALLTRAMAEMVRLGVALGARRETFFGLGGLGDLVATAHGTWSRNRGFGEALGRGGAAAALLAGRRTVVEGARAAPVYQRRARAAGVEAPILDEVCAVLAGERVAAEAVGRLMRRDLRAEWPAAGGERGCT